MLTAIKYWENQNILLIFRKCNSRTFYTKPAEVHMHDYLYYHYVEGEILLQLVCISEVFLPNVLYYMTPYTH
jgi:hypothetical protein